MGGSASRLAERYRVAETTGGQAELFKESCALMHNTPRLYRDGLSSCCARVPRGDSQCRGTRYHAHLRCSGSS